MNVVYVSNEAYAQHFAVSLASLCDCNPDEEELGIYLLDTGILPETAEKLKELAADFGRILTLIPCRNLEERFPERPDTGRFDLSTLGRFFLGELLPEDVKRVLYLDCDTVVQKSLHRMYKSELGGKLLAMAEEPTIYHEVKAYLGILPEEPYFNAGVMLVDLARWRDEEIGKQLLAYYTEIAPHCLFQDQDAINGLLRGRIAALHPKYNFITNYYYFSYAALEVFSPAYRKIGERRFRTAKRSPAIVHYAGDERPWRQGDLPCANALSRRKAGGREERVSLLLPSHESHDALLPLVSLCAGPALCEKERGREKTEDAGGDTCVKRRRPSS